MTEARPVLRSLIRMLVAPALLGALLGFSLVLFLLTRDQPAIVAAVGADPVPLASHPVRVTVILLDGSQETAVGLWQWWSRPQLVACVAAEDWLLQPQGATLGEVLRQALEIGDDTWVAGHTMHLGDRCGIDDNGVTDQVVLMTQHDFMALIDAVGGVELAGRLLDGDSAWIKATSPSLSARQRQLNQAEIWLGLATRTNHNLSRVCQRGQRYEAMFRAVPSVADGCLAVEWMLQHTPSSVLAP